MMKQFSANTTPGWRWSWRMAILAGVAALAALLVQPAPATIKGTLHDFSGGPGGGGLDPQSRICIFCHTAHGADLTVTDVPLWNHATTSKVYTVYSSPTMDATVGQPSGSSKLCLSCHDGTIAVDSYGGKTGVVKMAGPLAVGADELNNDHPISFVYDEALVALDSGLFSPSQPSGLGGSIKKDLLINDRVECASCHDVHNGTAAAAVNDSLLMITQVQSQLCLTCHNK